MMRPEFFDTHAHLDFPEFNGEIEQVIQRAKNVGVTRIISIGTTLEGSRAAVALAERFPAVFAAVGWHPSSATSAPSELPDDFSKLASHPKVVAIGETGLDFSRLPSKTGGTAEDDIHYQERQKSLFTQQLHLAAANQLNIILHQRDAFDETIALLRPWTTRLRAVFHCFVGTPDEQRQISQLGGIVSFTGIVTFKNAAQVQETARLTPLGSFMLETDCPYLAPVPNRGKRCEPAFVSDTAAFVATQKGCTLDELSESTCQTARQFFPKLS